MSNDPMSALMGAAFAGFGVWMLVTGLRHWTWPVVNLGAAVMILFAPLIFLSGLMLVLPGYFLAIP